MLSIKIPLSRVISYYNNTSKIIEPHSLTSSYQKYLEAEETFLKKIVPDEGKILEIGAGHGRIIAALNNGKRKLIGVEVANLSFLKKKYKTDKNIKILKMDAHKLSLKNYSFDVCLIMYNTLGLMHNPLKVLKECKRVTAKGGQIIISTYALDTKYVLKERMNCFTKLGHKIINLNKLNFDINEGVASHYFKKEELKELFKCAKLNPIWYPLTKLGCVWVFKV